MDLSFNKKRSKTEERMEDFETLWTNKRKLGKCNQGTKEDSKLKAV